VVVRRRDRDGIFNRGGWLWLQVKGRRVSLRTKDREIACLRAAELRRRYAHPAYGAAEATSIAEACAAFRTYAATAHNRPRPPSPATFEMYDGHFKHLCRLLGGETRLAKVDATAVDRYIETRRAERIGRPPPDGAPDRRRAVSANTVAKELSTLRQVLALGRRRGWYHRPLEEVIPDASGAAYVPLTRALTLEQVPRLLAELGEARAATCAYIVAFGADWCAVERAERDDLGGADWCARLVLVRGTKNRQRWAEVPLVAPFREFAELARRWLVQHGSFPPWGKQRCRDLAAACRRAGLTRVTPRDLRRTHGQVLAELGVPPYLIGDMLRHGDSRMAERIYGQRTREGVGRQVQRAVNRCV
jgi:integrase